MTILDVGCGSEHSSELILKKHKPGKLIAFALMPEQISLARARNIPMDFFVGNATDMHISNQSCSVAFVYGIVHHMPDWQKTLYEISGVDSRNISDCFDLPAPVVSWEFR